VAVQDLGNLSLQTKLTRRVPLVEQELPTLQEHTSSPPVFSGVRVTRSLVLCVCFVDRCLFFSADSFCTPYPFFKQQNETKKLNINRQY
jgi:hypothetical protein